MGSHEVLLFLLQVAALLLMALCLGRLAERLGMPAVVGELLTGVLLGPSVFRQIAPGAYAWFWPPQPAQTQLIEAVSLLGVLMFVGISGAHLDLRLVRRRSRTVMLVGGLAFVVPMALGIGAGCLLPGVLLGPHEDRAPFALLLGVVMAVSAIPVIVKTLLDLKALHREVGQLTLASAACQDVVAWLLLSVVSAMALTGHVGYPIALNLLYLLTFLLVAILIIRPLARAGLRRAARSDGPGPSIAAAVVLFLGCAALSHALGLEAVLGAFAAGILLGSSRVVDPRLLASLRTVVLAVFAPLFLAGAGLKMDLSALRDPGVLLVAAVVCVLAVTGKMAGAYAGARLARLTRWEGLALGAGLNARGAVEIVVATVGLRIGVLSTAMYTIVVLVAVLTSAMAPPLLRWAMARVELCADERLREVELSAWSTEAVPHEIDPAQN